MLSHAVGRLSTKFLLRPLQRSVLSESKFPHRISCTRYFSSTPILKQADAAAAKIAATAGAQITSATTPPVTEALAEKVLDISATSDITISKLAEGLSSDLLAASGVVPTLQDMGLGSYYTPAGLLQNALDLLHSTGLPWWAAIASVTLVMRAALFPLFIEAQKNSTKMNNFMPELQRRQQKMSEARQSGNLLEASRAANELAVFTRENGVNPMKGLVPTLVQAPIFISFFIGLRGMANLPVESMKTGGLYWFSDLTVPDPYYLLPLMTCSTVLIMVECGADGLMRADNMRKMRYAVRALPVIMFPIIMNFPAAILCYWTTTNFFSLFQTLLLRRPTIRKRFDIPPLVKHETKDRPPSKGFIKDMKETYTNTKLSNEVNSRAQVDEMRFKKAGTGPVLKTFKHPQRLRQSAND